MPNNQFLGNSIIPPISLEERVDIQTINIDKSLSAPERIRRFVNKVGNPYAFRCGNIAVNVVFSSNGKRLRDAFNAYLKALKSC